MGTRQAEFSLRIKTYRRVPTPLRSTSPSSETRPVLIPDHRRSAGPMGRLAATGRPWPGHAPVCLPRPPRDRREGLSKGGHDVFVVCCLKGAMKFEPSSSFDRVRGIATRPPLRPKPVRDGSRTSGLAAYVERGCPQHDSQASSKPKVSRTRGHRRRNWQKTATLESDGKWER